MGSTSGMLGFSSSGGKSSSTSNIDQTTTSNPWEQQEGFLTGGFEQAQQNLQQAQNPNAAMQQGWDNQLAQAGQMGDLAQQSAQTQQMLMSPDQLRPESNPYLQANLDAVQHELGNSLAQVNQGAVGQGMFGGARQGVAEGQAIGEAQRAANQMLSDHYTQGLQNMQQAQAQNAGVMQNLAMPGQMQTQVGREQWQLPQEALQNFWGIVGSNNWGGTEQTVGTETTKGSQKQSGWGTSFGLQTG